jgi:hypothetical protein
LNFAIHIGYSKTGTTTLQKHLFARHSQIHYLGKPYQNAEFKKEIDNLILLDTMDYRSSGLQRLLSTLLSDEKGASANTTLLSDERFVSYSKVRDKGVVAERIKLFLQPQKIFVTIRNQLDILKSAYLSRGRLLLNVPEKYRGRFVKLEDWLSLSFHNSSRSYIGHVDYYKTVEHYTKTFGKEKLCVFLFEEFDKAKETFIEKLSGFLDIDPEEALAKIAGKHEHKEISQCILDFERFKTETLPLKSPPILVKTAKTLYSGVNFKKKNRTAAVEIPDRWIDRLEHLYKEGNRKLVNEYGLPLAKYGYPL